MEILTLLFLGLVFTQSRPARGVVMMKYFLLQRARGLVILGVLISTISHNLSLMLVFTIVLFIKLGVPPFHLWALGVGQELDYFNLFIFSSFIKLVPLLFLASAFSLLGLLFSFLR